VKEKKVKPTSTSSDKALRKNLLRRKTRENKPNKDTSKDQNKESVIKST